MDLSKVDVAELQAEIERRKRAEQQGLINERRTLSKRLRELDGLLGPDQLKPRQKRSRRSPEELKRIDAQIQKFLGSSPDPLAVSQIASGISEDDKTLVATRLRQMENVKKTGERRDTKYEIEG